jgi:hypothetical protein
MSAVNWQKKFEAGIPLEYFSKFWQEWKPMLRSDSPEKLQKCGYQIREAKHESA